MEFFFNIMVKSLLCIGVGAGEGEKIIRSRSKTNRRRNTGHVCDIFSKEVADPDPNNLTGSELSISRIENHTNWFLIKLILLK